MKEMLKIVQRALLFVFLLISCINEQDLPISGSDVISISIEKHMFLDVETKTFLREDKICWGTTAADKVIYVFDSNGHKNIFTRTSPQNTGAVATFEGTVSSGATPVYVLWSGKTASQDQSILSGNKISGSSLTVVNPQNISNTESFANNANISVMRYSSDCLQNLGGSITSVSDTDTIDTGTLQSVFGYIRYTIPAGLDGCASIKSVTFTADEALSGQVEINLSNDEPVATIIGAANNSLTVNTRFKSGVGYEAGTVYAILPPGTYHNLAITITPFNGAASDSAAETGTPFTIHYQTGITVTRGKYTDIGDLPCVNPNPEWELPSDTWPADVNAFDYGVIETKEADLSYVVTDFPQMADKVTYANGLGFYSDKFWMGACNSWDTNTYNGVQFPLKSYISFNINKPGTLSFIPRVQNINTHPTVIVGLLTNKNGIISYQEAYRSTLQLSSTNKDETARLTIPITREQLDGITESASVYIYCETGQLLVYPIKWTVSLESEFNAQPSALERRLSVLTSENSINPPTYSRGICYYISSSGNDTNSGLSSSSPIRTLAKLSSLNLNSGDVVLFKRGDMWRREAVDGSVMISANDGVIYSAYGSGDKPILNGSPYNGAAEGTWSTTSKSNVYVYSKTFGAEVGGIFLDGTNESAYKQVNTSSRPFVWSDLASDKEFFQQDSKIYFYSTLGNPSERFSSMEFNVFGNIIEGGDNVVVDNICLRHSGSHAVNTWATAGMKVANCEIGRIGGAYWLGAEDGEPVRYGNGIQLYGSCGYFLVQNCWIYECFDTAVTHQLSRNQTMACVMENVTYRDNLIENCTWSFEWFLYQISGVDRMMRNILIEKNICRNAGYGWGAQRPDTDNPARHIKTWKADNPSENFVIKNNIFEHSLSEMFQIHALQDEWLPVFESNNICIN